MAPVEVFLRNIGRVALTVEDGKEAKLPSSQPERSSLYIKGDEKGGWYSTEYNPYIKGDPHLENLERIERGEEVSVDKKAVLRGI